MPTTATTATARSNEAGGCGGEIVRTPLACAARSRDNPRIMTTIPGARWWKIDVHTHTPASGDYGKGLEQASLQGISPRDWLLAYMQAGMDAVVVTDHNSGVWIDPLKQALTELEGNSQLSGYRPLVLFPGVEVTANGGAHILAVFPPWATTADINRLLGAVGATAKPGASDIAASQAPVEVVAAIAKAGAIPILAHVDRENSALETSGNTLEGLFSVPDLHAMEVTAKAWSPPQLYRDRKLTWSNVLGSDSHHPATHSSGQRGPGSHFTWVKMETPSHDGLALALLDGDEVSIRRSDADSQDPNAHAHLVIEQVTVTEARYCGRGNPLQVRLSPWLSTIIGGRGTGKSTLVQLLRLALQRQDELPKSLKTEFDAFTAIASSRQSSGALTANTEVQVELRKDGVRFRVRWNRAGTAPAIEEELSTGWSPAVGEIRQRFPVRIFSQGQIFEMARDSSALLKIIDDAPEVDHASWQLQWQREQHQFLSVRAKLRELEQRLAQRSSLEGSLADIRRKLEIFEQAEHATTLQAYQRSQRQRRELDAWAADLVASKAVLRTAVARLHPIEVDVSRFEAHRSSEDALLEQLAASRDARLELAARAAGLAAEVQEIATRWTQTVAASAWQQDSELIARRYQALIADLTARGISEVGQYGALIQERSLLEAQVRSLMDLATTVAQLRVEADSCTQKSVHLRKEITAKRESFLAAVLAGNPHVQMTIVPYGSLQRAAEMSFRAQLDLKEDKYGDDILSEDEQHGCLAELYLGLPADPVQRTTELERRLVALKVQIDDVRHGVDTHFGGRFRKHLRQLSVEAVDRLQTWFPPDELDVRYREGGRFRALEQGSPEQKTAAILAFLLAHGTEPIILDQPEDDQYRGQWRRRADCRDEERRRAMRTRTARQPAIA